MTDLILLLLSGEEEETAVFRYRAKLFRFDKDANQWKEKGIGEMKILCHKETGQFSIGGFCRTCFSRVRHRCPFFLFAHPSACPSMWPSIQNLHQP